MKVAVLASGSNGNSTCVVTKKHKFLIDVGISFKTLMTRLNMCGIDVCEIDSIFLTHEHYDHISGLKVLSKKKDFDVYSSLGTISGLNAETKEVINKQKIHYVSASDVIKLDDCTITILRLHHDANEPIGFVIEEDDKKIVYITDTGFIEEIYYPLLCNADIYIMESNYDVELLWTSNRPFDLKKRIDGDYGHMSNDASAVLLAKLMGDKTKQVVLAHISHDCNYYHMPDLIIKAHQKVYHDFGLDVSKVSFVKGSRDGVTGVWEI